MLAEGNTLLAKKGLFTTGLEATGIAEFVDAVVLFALLDHRSFKMAFVSMAAVFDACLVGAGAVVVKEGHKLALFACGTLLVAHGSLLFSEERLVLFVFEFVAMGATRASDQGLLFVLLAVTLTDAVFGLT